nr:CBP80/20-dependent translation initiation factor-like isoform X3 [Columba livia]
MENSSVASASSEAGSSRSQEIEELERFIDSYVLEYQVQGLLTDKTEGDGESEKTQSHISQWTADCSEQLDGSCSPSRGKGLSSHEHNQEEWDHSSSGSAGSRPGSGSRRGSGSRSGSRGRSSQFRQSIKNGNKETSLDMLGTDIWAANTFDSFSGVTWDSQPEKLDFTQFHRKLRNTSKHPLPHIDREGLGKGKYEDGDSINLNDIEKVLPVWQNVCITLEIRDTACSATSWTQTESGSASALDTIPLGQLVF